VKIQHWDEAENFVIDNADRIKSFGLKLSISKQASQERDLDAKVFLLAWPYLHGADVEIRVTRDWGIVSAIVISHSEPGGYFDDKPGRFNLAAYLDAHGRNEQERALFDLKPEERIKVYFDFIFTLIEGEWKDIIEGKRWEFIRDPMINDYF